MTRPLSLALSVSAVALCVALASCSKQSERERIQKQIADVQDSIKVYQIKFKDSGILKAEPRMKDDPETINKYGVPQFTVLPKNYKELKDSVQPIRDRIVYFRSLLDSLHKSLPPE